jgi:hypothetical protein
VKIRKFTKNSPNAIKIKRSPNYLQKLVLILSHENWLKNALFTANNVILQIFFAQDQIFQKFIKPAKKIYDQNKIIRVL